MRLPTDGIAAIIQHASFAELIVISVTGTEPDTRSLVNDVVNEILLYTRSRA